MIYLGIAGVVFLADFFIKHYVETHFKDRQTKQHLHGHVVFEKYYNDGAALNFLAKWPKVMKGLHTAVILFLCVLCYFLAKTPEKKLSKAGLALLFGGGCSNLLDRYQKGHVVDYVRFSFGPKWFRKIIFNVSDFCIFIGAVLAVIGSEA